jgi:hypothetical protein
MLEDGDARAVPVALRTVVDAVGGMAALADKTGLSRETLYRTLSERGNPRLDTREIKFNNDVAHQSCNVAIAKADGNRKVALATCESQSGDSQRVCKDQAEADYKTARADAKGSAEAAVQQK